jgi:hypothetical protein
MDLLTTRNDNSYGGHLANILEDYGVDDPAINVQILEWWKTEGIEAYIKIKAKHNGEQKPTFKESGAVVKAKLIELGAIIKK